MRLSDRERFGQWLGRRLLQADAIGLRALGLGARVIDVLDREVEFVLVPFGVAAELAAASNQSTFMIAPPLVPINGWVSRAAAFLPGWRLRCPGRVARGPDLCRICGTQLFGN
jgi:hypothetical protein